MEADVKINTASSGPLEEKVSSITLGYLIWGVRRLNEKTYHLGKKYQTIKCTTQELLSVYKSVLRISHGIFDYTNRFLVKYCSLEIYNDFFIKKGMPK